MITKIIVPELPSDEEIHKECREWWCPESRVSYPYDGYISYQAQGQKEMRDTHCAPLRSALVKAIEVLEQLEGLEIHFKIEGGPYLQEQKTILDTILNPAKECLAEIEKILEKK